jgi:phosphoribosylcarboxyaminoimidazole (NCAIR) mutase
VATVAINNSTNAALLALRILGTSKVEMMKDMKGYLDSLQEEVGEKIDKLETLGWEKYLAQKK